MILYDFRYFVSKFHFLQNYEKRFLITRFFYLKKFGQRFLIKYSKRRRFNATATLRLGSTKFCVNKHYVAVIINKEIRTKISKFPRSNANHFNWLQRFEIRGWLTSLPPLVPRLAPHRPWYWVQYQSPTQPARKKITTPTFQRLFSQRFK